MLRRKAAVFLYQNLIMRCYVIILTEIHDDPTFFGSGLDFVNRTQSDPGFVNPGFFQSDAIRSGPVRSGPVLLLLTPVKDPGTRMLSVWSQIVAISYLWSIECSGDFRNNYSAKDMDELLRYHFQKGFSYKNILLFLSKYHNTEVSRRSLQQRLHDMGFKTRNISYNIQKMAMFRRISFALACT